MTKQTDKKKHHHGNLREALITAGVELLEEGGIDALTLRKCAQRAGVSHAAPAHHFDGLQGLKLAIAERGFQMFSKYLRDAIDTGPQTPHDRMRSIAVGYVRFGQDHAGLLDVIFGGHGLAAIVNEGGRDEAEAYLILREVCAPFVPEGDNPLVVEAQVWSLIHGFTLLFLAGEFGPPDQPLDGGPFDQIMALLARVGTPP